MDGASRWKSTALGLLGKVVEGPDRWSQGPLSHHRSPSLSLRTLLIIVNEIDLPPRGPENGRLRVESQGEPERRLHGAGNFRLHPQMGDVTLFARTHLSLAVT